MLVATWNVEWAPPKHRTAIATRLGELDADVLVVTEGMSSVLPADGHVALGGADWGYRVADPDRRKVLLWSRYPLTDVVTDIPGMPPGRFIAATCHAPGTAIRAIGVCIPWRDAHVRSGRRDAAPWQEHLTYLAALGEYLGTLDDAVPTIIAGDFNQRRLASGVPSHVSPALDEVLGRFQVVTVGTLPGLPAPIVDHIAVSASLAASDVRGIPRTGPNGQALSDHDLAMARLDVRSL